MVTRRSFLTTAGLAAGGLMLPRSFGLAAEPAAWKSDPFSLGVASGEPRATSVLLWTRLAPDPANADPATPGGISGDSQSLRYEVATDEHMRHVVRRGTAIADKTYGYSVHQPVTGLSPGRAYWYRFYSGGAASPIGRAMTAPAGRTDKLHFAYMSCSHYEHGYFSAYRHAADEHPDLGIFLGDYIYEYVDKRTPNLPRHHTGGQCVTLADYRARYSLYRGDDDLRRLHATMSTIHTWDDHEVQNDYAGSASQDFADPLEFLKRRAAAYQAFYEFMPVSKQPNGSSMQLYDRYDFGDLMQIDVLDGRQYRSKEACYGPPKKGGGHQETAASCPELIDPSRSMIGMQQEAWLLDGLAKSKAHWNLLAQDVMMAQFREKGQDGSSNNFWTDDWNGYPASRARVLQHIAESKPSNPVVITGDIHSFWANDLKQDFDDPKSPIIASELIGSSITSPPPPYELFKSFLPDNPHIKFFESRKRGYVSVNLTKKKMTAKYQTVSDVKDPKASLSTLATFVVESGKAGPQAA
jgi:alkaline phosphatase D